MFGRVRKRLYAKERSYTIITQQSSYGTMYEE